MVRWRTRAAVPAVLAAVLALAAGAVARGAEPEAGPPFPAPTEGRAVYDWPDLLRPPVEGALERQIDEIEARSGAEVVVYLQVDYPLTEDENFANARALMDEWGVGRAGFDDGLVLLVGLDETREHGRVSLYGGAGFLNAYLDAEALAEVIDDEFVPHAARGDLEAALIAAIDAVDREIVPEATERLEQYRIFNAGLGLAGAPLAFALTAGIAWLTWRRKGDDPELLDSPSILAAGPPAGMTPTLATVVRRGRASDHSISTLLVHLASTGGIAFRNLDQVARARSDSEPDPLTDPAIVIGVAPEASPGFGPVEREAWERLAVLGGGRGELTRQTLWSLNGALGDLKTALERQAVRLGWFTRMPQDLVWRWTGIGAAEVIAGVLIGAFGWFRPMSGALLLGGALVAGGIATIAFGQAMSQRTPLGAFADGMLRAYRRTLQRTLEQTRSMRQVVEDADVRVLADTPDKAVTWGVALGLHREVAAVLARSIADAREGRQAADAVYYPTWLGSSSTAGETAPAWAGAPGGARAFAAAGSIFSGSPIPDFGAMLSALGSVGSTPPSSSSSSDGSGGGFSGGSSSGGGGASGSF